MLPHVLLSFLSLASFSSTQVLAAEPVRVDSSELDDLMTPDEIAEEAGLPVPDKGLEDEWEDARARRVPWLPLPEFSLSQGMGWKPRYLVPATPTVSPRQWVEQLNEKDKDLAQVVLVVNKAVRGTTAQQLRMYVDGVERMVYTVSTGREKYETAKSGRSYWTTTPTGYFRPTEIKTAHYSNTWKAWLKWVIFFKGGVAVHATTPDHYEELGSRASGGCVRVREEQAKEIFDQVVERGRAQVPAIQRDGSPLLDSAGRPVVEENWNTLVIVRNIED